MYYRLEMDKASENTFVTSVSHREVMITAGQPLGKVARLPFRFEMEVEDSYDQFDPDADTEVDEEEEEEEEEENDEEEQAEDEEEEDEEEQTQLTPRVFAYYRNVSLMHKSMVDVLRSAGVDNIEGFPAVIRVKGSKQEYRDHLVVNVIGTVQCANLSASETQPLGELHYFLDLAIDPKRTHGLRLFRLSEYPPEILVDEKVATALRNGNFEGLVLEPVKEVS